MTTRNPANIPASILARLKNVAQKMGVPHQNVLGAYARERFLYRLGRSPRGKGYVLKGAMLFVLWRGEPHRPTVDLDLLGPGEGNSRDVEEAFRAVAVVECPEDGICFDPGSVRCESIRGNVAYGGVRVRMEGRIGKARIPVQVDVGFGDAVTPAPKPARFPTMLDQPAPLLSVYPPESVIAEKVHAMAVLGLANTRLKDLFDVRSLAADFAFDGKVLSAALEATFRRRRTDFQKEVLPVLTAAYRGDPAKRSQWTGFVARGRLAGAPGDLGEVLDGLEVFLAPVLGSLAKGEPFVGSWPPGGPWAPRGRTDP